MQHYINNVIAHAIHGNIRAVFTKLLVVGGVTLQTQFP